MEIERIDISPNCFGSPCSHETLIYFVGGRVAARRLGACDLWRLVRSVQGRAFQTVAMERHLMREAWGDATTRAKMLADHAARKPIRVDERLALVPSGDAPLVTPVETYETRLARISKRAKQYEDLAAEWRSTLAGSAATGDTGVWERAGFRSIKREKRDD